MNNQDLMQKAFEEVKKGFLPLLESDVTGGACGMKCMHNPFCNSMMDNIKKETSKEKKEELLNRLASTCLMEHKDDFINRVKNNQSIVGSTTVKEVVIKAGKNGDKVMEMLKDISSIFENKDMFGNPEMSKEKYESMKKEVLKDKEGMNKVLDDLKDKLKSNDKIDFAKANNVLDDIIQNMFESIASKSSDEDSKEEEKCDCEFCKGNAIDTMDCGDREVSNYSVDTTVTINGVKVYEGDYIKMTAFIAIDKLGSTTGEAFDGTLLRDMQFKITALTNKFMMVHDMDYDGIPIKIYYANIFDIKHM